MSCNGPYEDAMFAKEESTTMKDSPPRQKATSALAYQN